MALNIGGFEQKTDFPKLGPSLLIGACLILAVRTAKWSIRSADNTTSDTDLEAEVEHAIHLAGRVLSMLVTRHAGLFPQRREAWFMPDDEDAPK